MATFYLIVGTPCSGKTTLAEYLSRNDPSKVLKFNMRFPSIDNISNVVGSKKAARFSKEQYVIDANISDWKVRRELVDYIHRLGHKAGVVFVDAPLDLRLNWDYKRLQSIGARKVHQETNRMQEITPAEGWDEVYQFNWTEGWRKVEFKED